MVFSGKNPALYDVRVPCGVRARGAVASVFALCFLAFAFLHVFFTPSPVRAASVPVAVSSSQQDAVPYAITAIAYRPDATAFRLLPGAAISGGLSETAVGAAPLFVAITLTPRVEGVYLYASASRTEGKPTEVGIRLPSGKRVASFAYFPEAVLKPNPIDPGGQSRVFIGSVTALVTVDTALAGQTLHVVAEALACSVANCTPLILEKTITLPPADTVAALPDVSSQIWWEGITKGVRENALPAGELLSVSSGGESSSTLSAMLSTRLEAERYSKASTLPGTLVPVAFQPELEVSSFGKAALLGFLAGIFLNLMPCVLPVLGIKLAALARVGGASGLGVGAFRRHQFFFALGVLVWFSVLSVLFVSLGLAWGQIFQSPAVVFVLAVLLLLLALNLFGVLTLPVVDLRADSVKHPDLQAFMSGFAATLLSTPCGGPLLGGVLGWALVQPPVILGLTLECVGFGMAFPYFALALFPSVASRLPRPGPWMIILEQFLGFLLLGTVAYLVSLLPVGILPRVIAALVVAAFGGWVWGKSTYLTFAKCILMRFAAAALVTAACMWPLMPEPVDTVWQSYTPAALAESLGTRPVLVDFTADWCPTCKVLEATTLSDANVRAWQRKYDLVVFRVDLTRDNPDGQTLLRALNSASIPVIAIFPTGEMARHPLVLRDIVTKGQVEKALVAARMK